MGFALVFMSPFLFVASSAYFQVEDDFSLAKPIDAAELHYSFVAWRMLSVTEEDSLLNYAVSYAESDDQILVLIGRKPASFRPHFAPVPQLVDASVICNAGALNDCWVHHVTWSAPN